MTNYESGSPRCRGRSYSAGASFTDPGGTDVHMLRNEGTVPAETIAVQLIPSGQPRRVDADQPANCLVTTAGATKQLHVSRFAIPN